MNVRQQAHVFAAMMLCGMGAGAVNDLLWIFRRGVISGGIADAVLGLICAAGVIATGLFLGCDVFRLYVLLGVLLGWAIYMTTFGAIVRMLLRKFINLSKNVTN